MREQSLCDGCGEVDFQMVESYAVEDGTAAVELLLWRCTGCGDESESARPLDVDVEDRPRARRVA